MLSLFFYITVSVRKLYSTQLSLNLFTNLCNQQVVSKPSNKRFSPYNNKPSPCQQTKTSTNKSPLTSQAQVESTIDDNQRNVAEMNTKNTNGLFKFYFLAAFVFHSCLLIYK